MLARCLDRQDCSLRLLGSHQTSHKQQHATRLATNPDRPARRVSQSPEDRVDCGYEGPGGYSERLPAGSGSNTGTQGPSTITASSSPGHGGRAVQVKTRGTFPVQRY